jgi:hypothetical protein
MPESLSGGPEIDGVGWGGARRGRVRRGEASYGRARLGAARSGRAELGQKQMAKAAIKLITEVSDKTNGGAEIISASEPYVAHIAIEGSADLLFHRWNCESVAAKAAGAKGSKAKKTDDIESYVYRMDDGQIAIPGEYLRMAIIGAAKFRQDPRSPRKSAMDLYKAAIVPLTHLAPLGKDSWDYLDTRRVTIQRNGISRTRPAMKAGWRAEFDLMVNLPEYVTRTDLREVIEAAGRLIGVGDFRPTFGRFGIVAFD